MATLTGVLVASVDGWISDKKGMVSSLAESLDPVPYIDSSFLAETTLVSSASTNTYHSSDVVTYTFEAMIDYSPFDDIYHRFYIIPQQLNFGAVTGDTDLKVLVWNAYITPEVVSGFSESGYVSGDNVSHNFGDATFPMPFFGYEVKNFQVSAGFTGNPEFSIQYTIETSEGATTVDVLGYRTVLFSLSPHREFTHTYKFETRITESFNSEQRASLGSLMFEGFEYSARASEYLRTYYRQLMKAGTLIRFAVPVWEDYVPVDSVLSGLKHIDVPPAHPIEGLSFYIGQTLVMWSDSDDYEQAKIVDINYSINRIYLQNEILESRNSFFLMPLRAAVNDDDVELKFKGVNSHHFECKFKLLEQNTPYEVDGGLTYLEGRPFLDKPNYQSEGSESFKYERDEFQGIGGDIKSRTVRGFAEHTKSYVWKCFSREEYFTLKEFIFATRGKWKSFWLPRFGREFKLYKPVNIQDSQFTLDLRNFTYNVSEFEDLALYIQKRTGEVYSGVINAATDDGGIVSISCNQSIEFACDNDSLIHICLSDIVRSTTDEIEVNFEDINEISCKLSVRKVKE